MATSSTAASTVPTSNNMAGPDPISVLAPSIGTQTVPAGTLQSMPLTGMTMPEGMPHASYAKFGPYTTNLDAPTEQAFQTWVKQNKIPWQDTHDADYDMRGYYRAMIHGDPNAVRSSKNLHFPDTWKTPYDKSFSNESIYATKDAPHWKGNKLVDSKGKVVFDEDKDGPG